MKTRGQLNRETRPKPGPLLQTQNVEEQSYKSTLGAGERSHHKQCKHHFGTIPSVLWSRAWSPHSVRNRSNLHALRARCSAKLTCGYRCGRPFLRTDIRDEQWYCGDHDKLLLKRSSRLLELPGEIRNQIYKHAFPPLLGLFPQRDLEKSSIKLLEVNKQIHEEVISLMYGEKPLRLSYEQDGLNLDTYFYDWDGQPTWRRYRHERKHSASALRRFLDRNAFNYVKDIEIDMDLEFKNAEQLMLKDFVCTLRAGRTRQRRLTINLAVEDEEVAGLPQFLETMRGAPEFKDMIFKATYCEGGIAQGLVQRAYAMRDSLLQGQKRKWGQME